MTSQPHGIEGPSLPLYAAALLAVDPVGLGGAVLRGAATPARDTWLATFRAMLPPDAPWRRMPPQIADGRLLGGLDLAATLAAGRPIAERGLMAEAHGGTLLVPMAERVGDGATSHLCAALDTGEVIIERDGIALRAPARFAAVLLDEGIDDERAPAPLTERLAFVLDLSAFRFGATDLLQHPHDAAARGPVSNHEGLRDMKARDRLLVRDGLRPRHHEATDSLRAIAGFPREDIAAARARLGEIIAGDEAVEALAATGMAFGVPSLRLATLALRAAKAAAALAGHGRVSTEDAELAAALVIAPRATMIPADDEAPEAEQNRPPEPPETNQHDDDASAADVEAKPMADSVVEATRAAIPADLLATLSAAASLPRQGAGGRAGAPCQSARRGRPAGVRRGTPGHGIRLAVVETLRAAAPWQTLRRRTAEGVASSRILVRREDFRIGRFKQKSETLTIFVVDASGSAALHRLAEVKGAVELVLADCYVRRDGVALIAFRGDRAELILPPTRSLVRAKRALAGLPGGGGTPLAAAIDAAGLVAQAARKKGQMPLVVLLTDGKANIARSGRPGRSEAEADAAAAAKAFRLGGASGLVLDIAPRPGDAAQRLAAAMGARYIPLPYADAQVLSRTVLAAGPVA